MITNRRIQSLPALFWVLVVALLMLQLVTRVSSGSFDTSILALLPQDKQQPVVEKALRRMDSLVANRVLFLIGGDETDRAALREQADRVAGDLAASDVFDRVSTRPSSGSLSALADVYEPYRYQLLPDPVVQKLAAGEAEQLVSRAARELVNPVGRPRPASAVDDPLNLLGHWLDSLTPAGGFALDEHGLFARDNERHYRVITASFQGDAFDQRTQKRVLEAVAGAEQGLEGSAEVTEILRSGLVFHAAAGAKQAKGELSTIGIGSVLAILLLLLWQFRSLPYVLLPVVSVGVGLLVALSTTLMVFGRVHLVTLAFGASLVGVSVDYAFHYLCYARQRRAWRIGPILPGIGLGLVSSCLAYGAQALTPFPGLQQIAVFSAAGLAGAWLTVVFWLPPLTGYFAKPERPGPLAGWLDKLAGGRLLLLLALVVVAAVAFAGIPRVHFDDRLAALQSSPAELVAQEQTIQALSRNTGSARFLLVEGRSVQQVLEREEQVRKTLDKWVADGRLQSYLAASDLVPSIDRQRRYRALVEASIYQAGLPAQLFDRLGMPEQLAQRSQASFEQRPQAWLTPDKLAQTPVAGVLAVRWLAGDEQESPAALISLGAVASGDVYDELQQLAESLDGVRFVDRVRQTSQLLADYRGTLGQWLALAYGLVLLVLIVRYRWQCWRVILPPALATLMTLGLLSAFGQPLNLFHLLATLLILGIGLDIGIFVRESHGQSHAWEAVTLSAATSLLAFGLLALSETPVLHHYGMTVLPGIALAWLIAFVLQRRTQR
ncbi:Predicted exporter [Marinobacter persicus]|uniref:Predicted exporter n=1 Tax=Marinobacter persicus TaxID=930118 RepID=A0A1I3WQG3_9GAMM|nr:Predicted exporter [Marinobacter persicus]